MSQGKETKRKTKATRTPNKSTSLTDMEETEIGKLSEISDKLTEIFTAIKELTNVIKDSSIISSQVDAVPVNPAIDELSRTLQNITQTISSQQGTSTTNSGSISTAGDEAAKVKAQITHIWDTKIERRKDAYWNHVKNKGHSDTYSKWLNSDKIVIPQYLQRKEFNNEHPDQKKVRETAVLNDFKTEIDLKSLRANQQEEKVKRIDNEMDTLFKEKGSTAAAKILSDMWQAQASQNEKISHRRWLKNEKWLKDYEENFKQAHISSSPFFIVKKREPATYAEVTKQPKKKTPTSSGVTTLPRKKTPYNQQGITVQEQRQKGQPNLEAIQTLLQQVQTQLNNQVAPKQQPKPRKTNRQATRPKTYLYEPVVVHSDNDEDFLYDSASTETLT